ncbi:hypothetical protein [Methylobacterium oxalidis]|uniref:Uncharacterized protein n=1 Tax=Methylobacterium oxalidis TaxID=944322 RepID=A0A512J6K8_9HYPH|nr:hypothetical protein [Methylobacterium oxalidis]GEP05573.1 hypothetical protein MOX02_36110 [Methylobacterium oxalidis]GJE32700.1 hypothetical protein LDDCCGHA_2888 [Methylobacterium oxalidis]GLS65446.1 hypothetical protein GCM10007888_38280 [Methylobacterium oxalidis]
MPLRVYMIPGQIAVTKPGKEVHGGRPDDYLLIIGYKTDHMMMQGYAAIDGARNMWTAFSEVFPQAPDVWWQMFYGDRVVVPPARWFPQAQQFVQSTVANLTIAQNAWTANFPIASNIAGAPAEPTGVIFTVHRRGQL